MTGPERNIERNIVRLEKGVKTEPIAVFLGTKLMDLKPGYARMTMQLRPEYQNFNGYVFGGIIMAIADQAFGFGSNTLVQPSIATQFNINFIVKLERKGNVSLMFLHLKHKHYR